MNNKLNILFVSHDVNRAGAQIFLWNIMMQLKAEGHQVVFLSKDTWGSMKNEFENNFESYYLNQCNTTKKSFASIFSGKTSSIEKIKQKHKIDLVYANTIACMDLLPVLKSTFKCHIISHIHELQYSINQYGCAEASHNLFDYSDTIIACSHAVAANLNQINESKKLITIHSFVDNQKVLSRIQNSNKEKIKEKYNLDNHFLVGACGNADWRKAADVFVRIAKQSNSQKEIKFVWIGIDKSSDYFYQVQYDALKLNTSENIIWIEPTSEAIELINCLDLFLVSSREDPFPLVMLEAALCEKPILGFKNTGGADEFVESDAGVLVEYLDEVNMAKQILLLYNDNEKIQTLGKNAKQKVLNKYSFEHSYKKIKNLINNISEIN